MTYVLKNASTVEEAIQEGLEELNIDLSQAQIEVIEEGSGGFLGLIGKKDALVRIGIKEEADISSFVKDILYDDKEEDKEDKEEDQPEQPTKPSGDLVEEEDKIDQVDQAQDQVQTRLEKIEEEAKPKEETIEEPKTIDKPVVETIDEPKAQKTQALSGDDLVDLAVDFVSKIIDEMDLAYDIEGQMNTGRIGIDIDIKDLSEIGIVIGKRGTTLDSIAYLTSLVINKETTTYTRVDIDANKYRKKKADRLESMAKKAADSVYKSGEAYEFEPMNPADRRIVHMALKDYGFIKTRSKGKDPNRRVVLYKKKLEED